MREVIDCFLIRFRPVDFITSAGCGPCHFADTIKVALSDGFAYNLNGMSTAGGFLNAVPQLLGFFLVPPRSWFFCWCLAHSSDANLNGGYNIADILISN